MRALGVLMVLASVGCGDDGAICPDGSEPVGDVCGTPDAGRTDAGGPTCAADRDCDDGAFCNGIELCAPGDPGADAAGCVPAPAAACLPGQTCSEDERRCLTDCERDGDADGDGHDALDCGGDDCDDADRNRYPGNTEICDAMDRDEDCDPSTFGIRDLDEDGWPDHTCCNAGVAGGAPTCGRDCDDSLPFVNPAETEVCDGVDNDCDGATDEDVLRTFFIDADEDGFGAEDSEPVLACDPPEGHVENDADCDDGNTHAHSRTAPEVCDDFDNDCDLEVDEETSIVSWWIDADDDGFGDPDSTPVESCTPPDGRAMNDRDCDDRVPTVNPSSPEVCNGIDDDCNGLLDHPDEDNDGDGHADSACAGAGGTDCNDMVATVYEGAPEICDGYDSDCSGDGGRIEAERDRDGDGHVTSATCTATAELSPGDCDDRMRFAHPGRAERDCNGLDDDCDGDVDEGSPGTCDGVVQVAVGRSHSCVVRMSGRVDCWGMNTYGALGDGTTTARPTPTRVSGLAAASRVAGGGEHSCVVHRTGAMSCWGDNSLGQLGDGTTTGRSSPGAVMDISNAVEVTAGALHTCARLETGRARCWGDGSLVGAVGGGAVVTRPLGDVAGLTDAVQVEAGDGHTCALRATGNIVCWGGNDAGQLGDGTVEPRQTPVPVLDVAGAVEVAAGLSHSCARLAVGTVACWGENNLGQIGDGTTSERPFATPVIGLTDVRALGLGGLHTCVVDLSGQVWCWGNNGGAQLGGSEADFETRPQRVVGPANYLDLGAASEFHACGRRASGQVMCWGSLTHLGDGSSMYSRTPVAVSGVP